VLVPALGEVFDGDAGTDFETTPLLVLVLVVVLVTFAVIEVVVVVAVVAVVVAVVVVAVVAVVVVVVVLVVVVSGVVASLLRDEGPGADVPTKLLLWTSGLLLVERPLDIGPRLELALAPLGARLGLALTALFTGDSFFCRGRWWLDDSERYVGGRR
jgi:hypothetical protein